ncbi:hypothetical protein DUNSADRAFT_14825 [Dunaliella salina]|uniref:Methyltransferase type 11 domain-containing protein n=1 Tax=Dunaliella salina TaxID=3046 RepID=A0ABQ7G6M2_DUNSA|nr:hypothetical protein DUNSADRAFT_14825 [Dunaliella salina]|eukprot:KAF5830252.1 hypothetical protein DUNSADRAFT_14825 [Dunaliella salina]
MGVGELAAGVAIGLAAAPLSLLAIRPLKKNKGGASVESRSTTSSVGGGATAYETGKAVDEYIQFHYGDPRDVLPYPDGPKSALGFPVRCALLCERFCEANKDFTGERGGTLALDVGCAVGGSTFELSRAFTDCLGIDYSNSFIAAAQEMKHTGFRDYDATVEGELTQHCVGSVPHDIDRSQVRFMQGDACNLPAELASFHAVLAANLLCRLPNPMQFLDRLPSLVCERT